MRTLSAVAVAAVALTATPALAGSKIFSPGFTQATQSGSVESNASQNRDPWVAQVFTAGNECLRIAVVSQGADLEAVLIGPDLRMWRNDDGNGLLRPLIKAQTGQRGWYPLVLSQYAGAAVNADFTLTVQRNPINSALCAGPTVPLAAPTTERKAAGAVWGAPPEGGAN